MMRNYSGVLILQQSFDRDLNAVERGSAGHGGICVNGNLLISYVCSYVCSLFGPRKEYQSVHLGLGSSRRY